MVKRNIRITAAVLAILMSGGISTQVDLQNVTAQVSPKTETTTKAAKTTTKTTLKKTTAASSTSSTDEDRLTDILSDVLNKAADSGEDPDKEETVYLISDSNGNIQNTIVSEWLKNPKKKDELEDVSSLDNIVNIKGNEGFIQNNSKVTWDAGGNDIYYQGESDKSAPVAVKATYYLDGNEIKPDDLIGKSGHVRIRYEYINNEKTGDVYVPFVMATGMIMAPETFSNIEVTNGKVINDGTRFIVVGYGMPGLAESLDLDKDKITLPDYFEVEADVSSFELEMSITAASAENLLGDEDIDISEAEDKINELSKEYQNGIDSLTDGVSQYTDGADKIADGTTKLSGGTQNLLNGALQLKDGAGTTSEGMDIFEKSVSDAYKGSKKLSTGAKSLKKGTKDLKSGVKQLDEGASALSKGTKDLAAGAKDLDTQVQSITLPDISSISTGEADEATTASIRKKAEENLGTDTGTKIKLAVSNTVAASAPTMAQLSTMSAADQQSRIASMAGAEAAKTGDSSVLDPSSGATIAQAKASITANVKAGVKGNVKPAVKQALDNELSSAASDIQSQVSEKVNAGITGSQSSVYQSLIDAGVDDVTAANLTGTILSEVGTSVANETSSINLSIDTDVMAEGMATQVSESVGSTVDSDVNPYITSAFQSGYGQGYGAGFGKAAGEFSAFTGALASEGGDFNTAVTDMLTAYAGAGSQVTLGKVGDTLNEFSPKITALKEGTQNLSTGADSVSKATESLKTGTGKLSTASGKLYNGAVSLSKGNSDLTKGLSKLDTGAIKLNTGVSKLKSGIDILYEGTKTLDTGADELNTAALMLSSNSAALNDGATQLEDATDMLIKELHESEDKADDFVNSFNKISEAGRNYQSFAGKSDSAKGSVKFIIKIDGIGEDKQ